MSESEVIFPESGRTVIIQGINIGVTLFSTSDSEDMDYLSTKAYNLYLKIKDSNK